MRLLEEKDLGWSWSRFDLAQCSALEFAAFAGVALTLLFCSLQAGVAPRRTFCAQKAD